MKIQDIEVLFADAPPVEDPKALYDGFCQETRVLPAGYVHEPGRIAFPCDTVYQRDVPIRLRDGVTIYADIFRPVSQEKLPVILSWGCSGKRGHNDIFGPDEVQAGVSRRSFSGLQAWAGADPAHWVGYGYAVVTPDPRGTYMSEGDILYFGSGDARDCYDCIEWIAARDWCSGKIGMCGSAWYGMTQWNVAATQPPHLTCIAPWCAHGDIFRYEYVRGGIPKPNVGPKRTFGRRIEDIGSMAQLYPLYNAYWADKAVQFENIHIPVFAAVAMSGFTSDGHMAGTFEGFHRIASTDKWLRMHPYMNFADLYRPESLAEQRAFYDHYLKGLDNGWTSTPQIRLCTFDTGHDDAQIRVEAQWPPAGFSGKALYLSAGEELSDTAPANEDSVRYAAQSGEAAFSYTMSKTMELTGYSSLRLYVEADGASDMDLYVRLEKCNANGQVLDYKGYFTGPQGRIRVSRRKLDAEKSTPFEPYQTIDTIEPLAPGEIACVDIPIYPTSMVFHAGERLRITISGHLTGGGPPMTSDVNQGDHVLHFGGNYPARLLIPVREKEEGNHAI